MSDLLVQNQALKIKTYYLNNTTSIQFDAFLKCQLGVNNNRASVSQFTIQCTQPRVSFSPGEMTKQTFTCALFELNRR